LVVISALIGAAAGPSSPRTQEGAGPAGAFTVAVGASATSLGFFVVSEDGSAVPFPSAGGAGFSILPIDLAGRLELRRFDPGRPRRVLTGDGLSRIVLPGGTSVFHYRHGPSFGFLAVGADGVPRILLDLPPVSGDSGPNPFLPFAAASSDGQLLAVATRPQAGGDVWLLSVDGSPLADGSTALNLGGPGALEVDPGSLAFAEGTLFFTVGQVAVYRAATGGTAPALPLALPPSGCCVPDDVLPEIAVSEDGGTVAFVAGDEEEGEGELEMDVYLLSPPAGVPVNLTQDPGKYAGAGYAPGSAVGPTLALSPDGSTVAYVRRISGEEELYVCPGAGGPPVHLTDDSIFEPYIDNVVVITIGYAGEIEFAAGGEGDEGGDPLTHLDFYRATVGAGGVTVENLTATSGSATPPFLDTGTLAILDAFALPGGAGRAVVSPTPGGVALRLVGGSPGASNVAYEGQAWFGPGVGPAGGRLFFPAQGTSGAPEILMIEAGAPASVTSLVAGPSGVSPVSLTVDPSGTDLSLIATADAGGDLLVRISIPSGQISYPLLPWTSVARSLAHSPSGLLGFALGEGPAGPFQFGLLSGGDMVPFLVPAGAGFFLR
jgi:hypothetical protein